MEKREVYTIYDHVAEEFGPLFESKNEGTALRSFRHIVKDVNNQGDYSLMKVGTFVYNKDNEYGFTFFEDKHVVDIKVELEVVK